MHAKRKDAIRVDKLLGKAFPGLTNRQIEESLELGLVRSRMGKRIRKGDYLSPAEIDPVRLEDHLLQLENGNPSLDVRIVAEEADFWVVDKPPGIAAVPHRLIDDRTLTAWARARRKNLREEFPSAQPEVCPHRLDTGTSGLQIVAKTAKSFANWRECFTRKAVKKTYLAWVWGEPPADLIIDDAIAHHPTDASRMVLVTTDIKFRKPVQSAISHVRRVSVSQSHGASLIQVEITTGVTHQIRVHLAGHGFPLVGDRLYDADYEKRPFKPPFHQLRAIVLDTPCGRWNLENNFELLPSY